MLKRKVYSELLQWKDQRRTGKLKKCLLVKGARQVGKSSSIELSHGMLRKVMPSFDSANDNVVDKHKIMIRMIADKRFIMFPSFS